MSQFFRHRDKESPQKLIFLMFKHLNAVCLTLVLYKGNTGVGHTFIGMIQVRDTPIEFFERRTRLPISLKIPRGGNTARAEAEFLDVIGTKVLTVFLLSIHI